MTQRQPRPLPISASILLAALAASSGLAAGQERVSLSAKDGHPLAGTLMKPASGVPKGGVLALPMANSQRLAFDPLLPRLAQAGLLALAIEPRYGTAAVEPTASRPAELDAGVKDVDAALELLVARGAPVDKLAIVGAASGAALAIEHARRTGVRVKALVLLSPGRDDPLPSPEDLGAVGERPVLILATSDEAGRGARALKEALASAEIQLFDDRLASGTGMFGRVKGVESTIADWLDRMLSQPSTLEIGQSRLVLVDGEIAPNEASGATFVDVPLGDGSAAKVRMSHSGKRLDVGFDIPEPYVRLNEVVIYVDASGRGSRVVDDSCYRVSFNPKNPARKPLMVQRGGLKGFEDSDEKGVIAFAQTPTKERHWSAEVSLDMSRFLPGDLPKSARLAFQINGQRLSDVRYYPDDAKVPTAPGAWVSVRLK
jgi:dienelactone hydrolase